VNFFIWIVIKNYWCDIKKWKSGNVLMLISSEKYKKMKKKKYMNSTVMYCYLTNNPNYSICHNLRPNRDLQEKFTVFTASHNLYREILPFVLFRCYSSLYRWHMINLWLQNKKFITRRHQWLLLHQSVKIILKNSNLKPYVWNRVVHKGSSR